MLVFFEAFKKKRLSNHPKNGRTPKRYTKRIIEQICPNNTVEGRISWAPTQVSKKTSATKIQYKRSERIRNRGAPILTWLKNGKAIRLPKTSPIAPTPAALLGMLRRIAYTQRTYHSGTIWWGVT